MQARVDAPIFQAIRENNIEEVIRLVKDDADLTALTFYNEREITPIQFAALTNKWEIVRLIAREKNSFDKDDKDLRYGSALYFALKTGEISTATLLLAANAKLCWHDEQRENALFIAIRAKYKSLISLIKINPKTIDLSQKNTNQQTAIMLAASLSKTDPDYVDIIKIIADNTSNETNKNDAGNFGYALNVIVKNATIPNKIALVKSLLHAGAAIDFQDELGNTCLHYAVEQNDGKLIAVLVANGANPSLKNDDQTTAIDIACIANAGNTALTLIEHNTHETDYAKALHAAIADQNQVLTQKLIEAGANCDVYDCEVGNVFVYQTLLHDNVDILQLLSKKLDLSKLDITKHGKTALTLAYQLNATQCQAFITNMFASHEAASAATTQYNSPAKTQKTFLKKLDRTIASMQWLIKKSSLMFWLDQEWISGRPNHIQEICYYLRNVSYNNPAEIHDAFFNIMNILLNLPSSTSRHPNTQKFDEESKNEMLAIFNQQYQPTVSFALGTQQQNLSQSTMTYTHVEPTYLPLQQDMFVTHEYAATYSPYLGLYPNLQQEQPPTYEAPHLTIPTRQISPYQALTDSMFPPVPTHTLNMPGIGMFALTPVASPPNTQQVNARESRQAVSLL